MVYLFPRIASGALERTFREVAGREIARVSASEACDRYRHFRSVCIGRNPFERLGLAHASFGRPGEPFAAFIERVSDDPLGHPAACPITLQVTRRPSFIGRFELLPLEWRRLSDFLDLDLPALGRVYAAEPAGYRRWYGALERAMAESLYDADLEAFGYAF